MFVGGPVGTQARERCHLIPWSLFLTLRSLALPLGLVIPCYCETPRNSCFSLGWDSLFISLLEGSCTLMGAEGGLSIPRRRVNTISPVAPPSTDGVETYVVFWPLLQLLTQCVSLALHLYLGLRWRLHFNGTQKLDPGLKQVIALYSFQYNLWFYCLIKNIKSSWI